MVEYPAQALNSAIPNTLSRVHKAAGLTEFVEVGMYQTSPWETILVFRVWGFRVRVS